MPSEGGVGFNASEYHRDAAAGWVCDPTLVRVLLDSRREGPGVNAEGTPKPSLLVVDDGPAIRLILEEYFSAAGWAVTCAASEDEARARLAVWTFNVAILDLRLSKRDAGDGFAIICLARTGAPTKTILLTGYGSEDTRTEAMALGAAAVLERPLCLAALREVVSRISG